MDGRRNELALSRGEILGEERLMRIPRELFFGFFFLTSSPFQSFLSLEGRTHFRSYPLPQ